MPATGDEASSPTVAEPDPGSETPHPAWAAPPAAPVSEGDRAERNHAADDAAAAAVGTASLSESAGGEAGARSPRVPRGSFFAEGDLNVGSEPSDALTHASSRVTGDDAARSAVFGQLGADPDPGTEMELDDSLDGPLEECVPRVRRSV